MNIFKYVKSIKVINLLIKYTFSSLNCEDVNELNLLISETLQKDEIYLKKNTKRNVNINLI